MSNRKDWFINETFKQLNAEVVSTTADPQKRSGSMLQAKGIGTIILNMHVGKSIKRVRLDNVLCA